MAKIRFRKREITIPVLVIAICLVVLILLLISFQIYKTFTSTTHKYLVRNKYYSFEFALPKGWNAKVKTIYSEEIIKQILDDCKNNGSEKVPYEVGRVRLSDQKYPDDFVEVGPVGSNNQSGAILDMSINCYAGQILAGEVASLMIAGESASSFILESGKFGEVERLSLAHDNLKYDINKYVYVSSLDVKRDQQIKNKYEDIFDKIIGSLKFR